ncbi:MAG: hypothetical protein A2Z51_08370 [Deltaproteobacteria bacterium RBG_19FT_COMBO_52_11]|nr:MAG: hypothetical protein A2Z51_08370 [Deltaproteobacteria bacterium RBG_19FT_COMBO_52_11]
METKDVREIPARQENKSKPGKKHGSRFGNKIPPSLHGGSTKMANRRELSKPPEKATLRND